MVSTLDAQVRVTESDFYFNDPHSTYREMREQAPVYWHEVARLWVLTAYDDIEYASKRADLFSVGSGVLLTDALKEHDYLSKMFPDGVENVSVLDPPRHTQVRRLMNYAFGRSRIESFGPRVRELVTESLDAIAAKGEAEVVRELSIPVTANVIKAFINCEELTVKQVVEWSDDVFRMGSDITQDELHETVARIKPMFDFFIAKVESARVRDEGDFLTHLVNSQLDGEDLSTLMAEVYLQSVMVAGNETTRNGFTAAIRLFSQYPDQYRLLCENPDLVKSAVEEILRFHNPTIGFLRTATQDTELHGQKIAKGERVYLVYGAANRDPEYFDDPDRFDITRFTDTHKSHLTFGRGPHICIGMALARLEMQTMVEELLPRFSGFELTGDPVRPDTLLGNGYLALPTRFLPA